MSTEDNKIIHFPGSDPENEKITSKKQLLKSFIHKHLSKSFIAFVLGTILIPAIGFVLGPYFSKNIGRTKITDTYTLNYTSAVSSASLVNYNEPDHSSAREKYTFACAVRTCFSCSKTSIAQATDNTLNILSIHDYSEPVLNYHCLASGNTVNFYIVNSGDAAGCPEGVTLLAKQTDTGTPANSPVLPWDKVAKSDPDTAFPLKPAPVEGGDGIKYYSFEPSDWAFSFMQDGGQIGLYGKVENKTESAELFFGIMCLYEGRLIIEGGGAGPGDSNILNYVYIPVDHTSAGDIIPIHSTFLIQDRAAADTVLIPDKSCRLKYSLTYKIDGKELTAGPFTTTIHVPLYENMSTLNIANYMNDAGMDYYQYTSNPELQEKVGHDPVRIVEGYY